MIRLKQTKISWWPSFTQAYSYVRKKQIDKISEGYGNTKIDQIKKYSKVFAHIAKEGLKGIKNDIVLYNKLRKKSQPQYTSQDWNELIRLHHDFFRLGPLVIIQILPMSGPLFILYMYTYPGSIPSWFIVDKFHEDYQRRIRVVQKQAVQYFHQKNLKPADIDIDKMTLQQARRLSQCLYGYYSDGTIGYKKLFHKQLPYIINESFSKYMIKRKLKHKFRIDLQHRNILRNMSFQEKVRWKYQEVMVHGRLLKNYEDTLTTQELNARKQQEAAEHSMASQGNKNIEEGNGNGNGNGKEK